jgi:hypothetical protein
MPKAKERATVARGHYVIADLAPDLIRLDLLDVCLPTRTGVPEDGWGGTFLTCEQAIELAQKLTSSALRCKPMKPASKRR